MLTTRLLILAAAGVLAAGLAGCASFGSPAAPHQHMRDAKQGFAYPAPAADATPRKLLHDHREMK